MNLYDIKYCPGCKCPTTFITETLECSECNGFWYIKNGKLKKLITTNTPGIKIKYCPLCGSKALQPYHITKYGKRQNKEILIQCTACRFIWGKISKGETT